MILSMASVFSRISLVISVHVDSSGIFVEPRSSSMKSLIRARLVPTTSAFCHCNSYKETRGRH